MAKHVWTMMRNPLQWFVIGGLVHFQLRGVMLCGIGTGESVEALDQRESVTCYECLNLLESRGDI